MKFIGIDPGLHGAIAIYDGEKLVVHDMPIRAVTINKKKRNQLNMGELADLMREQDPHGLVTIEAVHAMPAQGVTSSFSFGLVFGAIQQAVACNFYTPALLVTPQKWKAHYGLDSNKDLARAMAAAHFPLAAGAFARKKDDGRAESVLLALYGKWWANKATAKCE